MPALENEKHEAFCRHLAKGKSISQAYADAGYQACRQNASRLSSCDDIKARVLEIKETRTTEPDMNGRDPESGRFLSGREGGPGRAKGSRNKLAEAFVADLAHQWEKSGLKALERVAEADPTAFVKVVAGILPAKIDQTLDVNIGLFAEIRNYADAWKLAQQVIGADPLLIEGNTSE